MVSIILCFACIWIIVYFVKRERKMANRMQDMLDKPVLGVFEDKHLDESKLSLLENTMWRYICDNRLVYMELSDEKEQMQKLVSDISHQAVTPVSNIILYSQLLEEELLSIERPDIKEAVESVHAIMEQAGKMDFFLQMLVKLSRLENGIISVKPVKQSISSVLQVRFKKEV